MFWLECISPIAKGDLKWRAQRLGRDNFQEQDMRLIASILGCPFQLSIMSGEIIESAAGRIRKQEVKWNEQEQPEESFSEETVETEKEEQQLP